MFWGIDIINESGDDFETSSTDDSEIRSVDEDDINNSNDKENAPNYNPNVVTSIDLGSDFRKEYDETKIQHDIQSRKKLMLEKHYWTRKHGSKQDEMTEMYQLELQPIGTKWKKEKQKVQDEWDAETKKIRNELEIEKRKLEEKYQGKLQQTKDKYQPHVDLIQNKYKSQVEKVHKYYRPRIEKIQQQRKQRTDSLQDKISIIEERIGVGKCSFCHREFTDADHDKEGTDRNYKYNHFEHNGEDRCPACSKLRYCIKCDRNDVPKDLLKPCFNVASDSCCIGEVPISEGCLDCVKVRPHTCNECDIQLSDRALCTNCFGDTRVIMECGSLICHSVNCRAAHLLKCDGCEVDTDCYEHESDDWPHFKYSLCRNTIDGPWSIHQKSLLN